jgi:hypothetical protein
MNDIEKILKSAKTIAVVGLSDKPERDSYDVAEYLQNFGYKIIPVNPNISEWKGIKAYASLLDVKEKVDVVDIFRRSEFVEEIVGQASTLHPLPKAIWMQLGIENEKAAEKAKRAGLVVIQNRCMKTEHETMNSY